MSFPAIVFQSWLVINSFHFYAIISFYAFVFTSAENMLLLPGLHVWRSAQQQSLMKILSLRKREVLKQLKKITSATVLASVHSTGAPAVGSINVTEFWQRRIHPPSFLLLLSRKMDLTIQQWSTLCPGCPMIYYNYRFLRHSYICTSFLHWCAVFHRKKLKWNWGSLAVLMK